jgi:sugar O-acyltransferase (sialic acid O-acetyltransferase NeuD family)
MRSLFAIYGASGCGRGIMPLAREQLVLEGLPTDQLLFVDDHSAIAEINGLKIVGFKEFLEMPAAEHRIAIAIADATVRERIAGQCQSAGATFWSIKATNAVIMDDVEIGDGALISPFVTMTSNIRIGRHFHANIGSYVEHDCRIGDFVTFAPGVKCNGNVVIEDHVYIGAGAIIRQGKPGTPVTIGRGSVIGMGAVVTKDVPPGVTVAGNPARLLPTPSTGRELI